MNQSCIYTDALKRKEADSYRFFIDSGLLCSLEDTIKMYIWFDCDWQVKDPQGKTRMKLLSNIPDIALVNMVNVKSFKKNPGRLVAELLRRLAPYL